MAFAAAEAFADGLLGFPASVEESVKCLAQTVSAAMGQIARLRFMNDEFIVCSIDRPMRFSAHTGLWCHCDSRWVICRYGYVQLEISRQSNFRVQIRGSRIVDFAWQAECASQTQSRAPS